MAWLPKETGQNLIIILSVACRICFYHKSLLDWSNVIIQQSGLVIRCQSETQEIKILLYFFPEKILKREYQRLKMGHTTRRLKIGHTTSINKYLNININIVWSLRQRQAKQLTYKLWKIEFQPNLGSFFYFSIESREGHLVWVMKCKTISWFRWRKSIKVFEVTRVAMCLKPKTYTYSVTSVRLF